MAAREALCCAAAVPDTDAARNTSSRTARNGLCVQWRRPENRRAGRGAGKYRRRGRLSGPWALPSPLTPRGSRRTLDALQSMRGSYAADGTQHHPGQFPPAIAPMSCGRAVGPAGLPGSPPGIPRESAGSVRQTCLHGLRPAPPGRFRERNSAKPPPAGFPAVIVVCILRAGRFCFESGPNGGPDRRPASRPSKEYP